MRNRTRQQSMADRHDYDQKAEKTQDGELVSSFMCSPETAAEEFELSKRLYFQITGRSQPVHRDVIMYRVIQSFKPGEVSPEEANRIGYELAMKLTEGKHQFVVSTHVDKAHIHTHIEFNSTNLNCDGKFVNPKDSYLVLRRLNDDLCRAHGLSVIENPKPSKKERKQKEMEAVRHVVLGGRLSKNSSIVPGTFSTYSGNANKILLFSQKAALAPAQLVLSERYQTSAV